MTGTPRYADPDAPLEARVDALLQALTTEEKLSLCAGQGAWGTKPVKRLGLKSFRMTDGPRGVGFHSSGKRCTAFPSGISHAASWDESQLRRFGAALAQETLSVGARMVLAPAINITRTPMNGRTFEYLSEDPLLNSRLSVSVVEGIQGEGVAACIKHFAANSQETERMSNNSEVSERALQEIYLPAFKASIEQADAWSVMAAYNAVNGVAACESADLLKSRLRDQWGFRGFVVSDWFAVRRTTSPEACVKAGLGLEMPGRGSRYKYRNIRAAYAQGLFTEEELDQNLKGLFRVMALTGHLDGEPCAGERNTAAHQSLAREMAESGMTLLKNDRQLLPLDPAKIRKVAAIGPKLKRRNCWPLWGGSAGVWPPHEITPWEGLQRQNQGRFEWVRKPEEADVVLLFIGLSHMYGQDSEVRDRKSFQLPGQQDKLVRETVAANPNTVVVLINGGPVAMPWVDDVPAILEAWYPGMEGGTAIANTLFGEHNPAGKLPVTFPRHLKDSPAHKSARSYPGIDKNVVYEEELFVGYRHFDKSGIEPLFPFGHGLSYTQFSYSDIALSGHRLTAENAIEISIRLTNNGPIAGAEVVQLYVTDLQADEERPLTTLKGFARQQLEPGEDATVLFQLRVEDLAIFCQERGTWHTREGNYRILLGSSSRDIRQQADFWIETTGNSGDFNATAR